MSQWMVDARGQVHAQDDYCDKKCRPVVVIDPEDDELTAALSRALHKARVADPYASWAVSMQAALRSLVTPPPPCGAALNLAGEHFGCDQPDGHGTTHTNRDAEAVWVVTA